MRLFDVFGNLVPKNVSKYRVEWDKPCRSKIQYDVKQFLKKYWFSDILYEEMPVYGTRLKVDFFNATRKIAVEVDGAQHEEFNSHFHKNSRLNYLASIKRDRKKEEWLELNGYKLARIKEEEVEQLSAVFFKKQFGFDLV